MTSTRKRGTAICLDKIIKLGSLINTKEQSKSEQRITSHSYQNAPKPHVQQHTCEKHV